MNKKLNLSEIVRDRANELRVRALLVKMLKATNNNFQVIIEHIKNISSFMDFDYKIIIGIMKEILNDRYAPTTDEIIKINLLFGLTIKEIADRLDMKESTVKMHMYRNKNNIDTIIIYPRLQKEQLQELRKFLRQYYSLYVPANTILSS